MKNSSTQLLLLAGFGLAIGTVLPSCVEPYRGRHHTVTTYQPGDEVSSLPKGYRTEVINGTSYYCHGDTYYRPRHGRYVVVQDPRGGREHVVSQLPRGYRTVHHKSATYYEADGVFYQKRGAEFRVVPRPY